MLAKWGEEVPAGFRFALKAPQRITHQLRLAPESRGRRAHRCARPRRRWARGWGRCCSSCRRSFEAGSAEAAGVPAASCASSAPGLRAGVRVPPRQLVRARGVRRRCASAGAALCIAEDEKLATPLEATARLGLPAAAAPGLRRRGGGRLGGADQGAALATRPTCSSSTRTRAWAPAGRAAAQLIEHRAAGRKIQPGSRNLSVSFAAIPHRPIITHMPARAIGTGSISFGLVAIPVKLYPATQSQRRGSRSTCCTSRPADRG